MLRLICLPWWWIQRRLDKRMLWPICRQFAPSLDEARDAFFAHAVTEACWFDYYGPTKLAEHISTFE